MCTCAKIGIALLVLGLMTGCVMMTPSIFYPKTSVHGLVLDQDDKPVSQVDIEVRKDWPYSMIGLITMSGPYSEWHIKSDDQGRWEVSARKVGELYIEAMPPTGYKIALRSDRVRATYIGPFGSGDCPTNDFILRLEKLPTKTETSK